MKTYPQMVDAFDYALERAIRRALKKHGSLRDAADALQMPKSTLHDFVRRRGIEVAS